MCPTALWWTPCPNSCSCCAPPKASCSPPVGCAAPRAPSYSSRSIWISRSNRRSSSAWGPARRQDITEVCSLATRRPGHARLLIERLTHHLHHGRQRWVVFTAVARLRNAFARLGLEPVALAPADPARLGPARSRWGSYYDESPLVMAGDVAGGYQRLQRRNARGGGLSGWRLLA